MSTGNLTLLWKSLGVLIFSMTKLDAKKKNIITENAFSNLHRVRVSLK